LTVTLAVVWAIADDGGINASPAANRAASIVLLKSNMEMILCKIFVGGQTKARRTYLLFFHRHGQCNAPLAAF
jgi:hypothetical protein